MTRPAPYPVPLSQAEAARALGISDRMMTDAVKNMKEGLHFDQRGRKRVFYPEQIERLRSASWVFASSGGADTPTRTAPLPVRAYDRALELVMRSKQRKPARS